MAFGTPLVTNSSAWCIKLQVNSGLGRSSALRLVEHRTRVIVTGLYTEGGDDVRGMF